MPYPTDLHGVKGAFLTFSYSAIGQNDASRIKQCFKDLVANIDHTMATAIPEEIEFRRKFLAEIDAETAKETAKNVPAPP